VAGLQELLMLRELGFDTRCMQPGQGLDERGFATAQVMWKCWAFGQLHADVGQRRQGRRSA